VATLGTIARRPSCRFEGAAHLGCVSTGVMTVTEWHVRFVTRPARLMSVAALCVLGVGCSSGGGAGVPPEFRPACGHPGAHVEARHVPVTISHAKCDLTGVLISYKSYNGAYVPRHGIRGGIGSSTGFTLTVHSNGDVTVKATGEPGNA